MTIFPSMAATPTYFPFIVLLSLSLLLLLSLFFRRWTKRPIRPPSGCPYGVRLGLHSRALPPQPPPRGGGDEATDAAGGKMECLYPFTSLKSATQRKIKLLFDEVMKSNEAGTLTMAQFVQYFNCLVDTREELKRRSEGITRKYRRARASLSTANKSSFDRLCRKVNELEIDINRIDEDITAFNRLQEQLQDSPAYETMVEARANMEQKVDSDQAMEVPDISFEEFLAEEKKDPFWQGRKLR